MAICNNIICSYDFETTHFIAELAEPIELAAVMIHPRRLEIIDGATFHSFIAPPNIDEVSQDNISFHAKAHNTTEADIIQRMRDSPKQEVVWRQFAEWLKKYHCGSGKKTFFNAPIRAGQNIISYDNIIWEKLCKRYDMVDKYGKQNISFSRDNIDLLNFLFMWFENDGDGPKSYSMDNLRPFFEIPADAAHTAMNDVLVTSELIIRFMKLHRSLLSERKIKFKGSMANFKIGT